MSRYPSPTIHASRGALPVLLSVPHSGREYDPAVLANAARGPKSLEALEDPLVDRLAWRAIAAGIGAVIQPVPRAVIDCNRDEEEVDPAAISGVGPSPVGPRARHGLGIIPSRTHRHGALWRRPVDRAELDRRLDEVHRPFHQSLADALDALAARFGDAVLIDCHSMPTRRGQVEIILGDRHGSSCAPWVTEEAARLCRQAGFRVGLNEPYAGGAIVTRHGKPAEGIHAIQLEIDRARYLKADGRTPSLSFDRIADLIERIATGLGQLAIDRGLSEAAE
jgi:N-formylglutamate amidohydrolase